MAVDTSDLTTLDTVSKAILKSDAEDALTREVFNSGGTFSEDGKRGISVASDEVKGYLTRELTVSKYLTFVSKSDWKEPDKHPKGYRFRLAYHRIRDWPVHKVEESDTKIHRVRTLYAKRDDYDQINYVAGYRREDQDLSDFGSEIQSEFGSTDDIPTLPSTVVDVVNNLAIHYAMIRISGLVGKQISEQEIGDFSTTVRRESAKSEYPKEQLKRLQDLRLFT